MSASRHSRGNILFLILLAIVLFVALSYAIMGQREGSKSNSSERVATQAATIMQTATLIANTVNRLVVINGCKPNEISFQQNTESGYTNPNMTTSRCKVFDAAGGGAAFPIPDPLWMVDTALKWSFTGYFGVIGIGTDSTDSTSSELVAYLPNIRKDICLEINKTLGLTNPNGYQDQIAGVSANAPYFVGSFAWHGSGNGQVGNNNFPPGQHYGCVNRGDIGVGDYFAYYHVLLAR